MHSRLSPHSAQYILSHHKRGTTIIAHSTFEGIFSPTIREAPHSTQHILSYHKRGTTIIVHSMFSLMVPGRRVLVGVLRLEELDELAQLDNAVAVQLVAHHGTPLLLQSLRE